MNTGAILVLREKSHSTGDMVIFLKPRPDAPNIVSHRRDSSDRQTIPFDVISPFPIDGVSERSKGRIEALAGGNGGSIKRSEGPGGGAFPG